VKNVLKTLGFLLVAPGTVAGWIPYFILRSNNILFSPAGPRLLGFLPLALGLSTLLWCAWDFAVKGQGTPAPIDPPKKLVVQGLYRFVRNPMYVGIELILLGETILWAFPPLLGYAFAVFALFNLFIFFYEEPALRGKFGKEYERYRRAVPRWIPRSSRHD
jgi:protein-S-isoprenylcysteine O-methyltransferase Ste14